eukprot:CAMPEP_0176062160 /NCGR_PEP_ID=MMETSP0120_2-20121206/30996_1 /TAXON_ID=160619 /ORGANISM="Kryptoperidinium foliaceum, Strain CCMP 1326" /LENGTH=724 /DNA_ID=CAMNT_0017395725 /DNA_START=59 /DNA_END=2233 /DNA_ORIENTATION=-
MKRSAVAAVVAGLCAAHAAASPVERVVNLLQDLKGKLDTDEKVEQKVYDRYACWCEKTTERKAGAISEAQGDLRSYGQTILSLKGKVATLSAEIDELAEGIDANKKAQEMATAVRSKENAAYMAETAEMKQAIAALEQAVTVLVKGTSQAKEGGAALLQARTQATSAVRAVISALPSSVGLSSDRAARLTEFLEEGSQAKYMPQSFTVQGILVDMYDTFAADLEAATRAEAAANTKFEDYIAVKTVELKDMQAEKAKKEGQKAEAEVRLADTQEMYDDTAAQKEADVAFFDETKAACQEKHEEWSTRSSLREEEIAGIVKALEILTSDEARELFASAIKPGKEVRASDAYDTGRDITPSFLQLVASDAPARAYNALKAQAKASHSLRLAALAIRVREAKAGHFDKVISAIDDMIKTLKEEDRADIAKRDQCKEEFLKIESTSKDLQWKIKNNAAKIDKLTKLIELRTAQKERTIQEIADVDEHMAQLTAMRTEENTDFLNAKKEDQDAIDLLMAARDALASYYSNHTVAMGEVQGSVKGAFLQQPEFEVSADQAPEAKFSDKGERKHEAKGIVSIMTMIIEDLNDEIKNGMKAEEEAQLEYESQMTAAKKLREELVAKKVSLEEAIAKRGEEKEAEIEVKTENLAELDDEQSYKASIKPDCDWIIGAFEKRAAAREAELNGLVGAKEFLVGYQPPAAASLLEKSSPQSFDDRALSRTRFLGLRR